MTDKIYAAYFGRKCIIKTDCVEELEMFSCQYVRNTGKNRWIDRHCGSVVLWDNINLVAIGIVTDDGNGLKVRWFQGEDY